MKNSHYLNLQIFVERLIIKENLFISIKILFSNDLVIFELVIFLTIFKHFQERFCLFNAIIIIHVIGEVVRYLSTLICLVLILHTFYWLMHRFKVLIGKSVFWSESLAYWLLIFLIFNISAIFLRGEHSPILYLAF